MATKISYMKLNDFTKPQIVDDIFKRAAGLAGIPSLVTPTVYSNAAFVATGAGTALVSGWKFYPLTGNFPYSSYVMEFDYNLNPDHWAIRFFSSGSLSYFLITDNTLGLSVYRDTGSGVATLISSTPFYNQYTGRIKLAVRSISFEGDPDANAWVSISISVGNELIHTVIDKPPVYSSNFYGIYLGIPTAGTSDTFANISIKSMSEFADTFTVDPGDPAAPGLSRAIEGYFARYFMRATGELKVRRHEAVFVADETIAASRVETKETSVDIRAQLTTVRMIGAYVEAEESIFSFPSNATNFYRFGQVNNPFLMTRQDCSNEAKNQLARMAGEARTVNISMAAHLLLEPEDRITLDGENLIITSITTSFDEGGAITQQISARTHVNQP